MIYITDEVIQLDNNSLDDFCARTVMLWTSHNYHWLDGPANIVAETHFWENYAPDEANNVFAPSSDARSTKVLMDKFISLGYSINVYIEKEMVETAVYLTTGKVFRLYGKDFCRTVAETILIVVNSD